MALFDLPLDALRAYRAPDSEPAGFDEFWRRTLAETRAHPLNARFEPVECSLEIAQVVLRLPQQCQHLRSLVGDGRSLRVVLVVGRGEFGGADDRLEAALERSDLLGGPVLLHLDGRSQRLLLVGFQRAHRAMMTPIGWHAHATV